MNIKRDINVDLIFDIAGFMILDRLYVFIGETENMLVFKNFI